MVKPEVYVSNLPVHEDRLHVANGTLFLNGEFTDRKEFCRNRLPVKYDANAPQPVTWLHFYWNFWRTRTFLLCKNTSAIAFCPLTVGRP